MTKCKHSSSTVQADHGNVTLSECDWGCGAIIISIERDGIARTMTADEVYNLKAVVEKVDSEAGAIIENEANHVSMYYDAMQENEQLRAQLAAAERIFEFFGGLGQLSDWENAQGESAEYVVSGYAAFPKFEATE